MMRKCYSVSSVSFILSMKIMIL